MMNKHADEALELIAKGRYNDALTALDLAKRDEERDDLRHVLIGQTIMLIALMEAERLN